MTRPIKTTPSNEFETHQVNNREMKTLICLLLCLQTAFAYDYNFDDLPLTSGNSYIDEILEEEPDFFSRLDKEEEGEGEGEGEDFWQSSKVEEDRGIFIPLFALPKDKQVFLKSMGVVGMLMAFDQPIMDFVQDNKNEISEKVADLGDLMGTKEFLFPIATGSLAIGYVFKNKDLKEAGLKAVGSAITGQIIVETLKSLTHRKRPNKGEGPYVFEGASFGSDNTSFPSGHAAGAWSVATVFAEKFKDTKIIPIVAYSLATITSLSRIHDEKHWASDAVLGSVVGYLTGKIITNFGKKMDQKYGGLQITPNIGETLGITIKYQEKAKKKYKQTGPIIDKKDCVGHMFERLCKEQVDATLRQYEFLNGGYIKE